MQYKILVVDDDKDFRDEFRNALEEYEIAEAFDGEEALRILKRPNEIGMVILDVMMPGLRGTEVLKEIKKISPELGIIILTGHGSKNVIVEALRGRADEYIEKPVDIDKMKEIIERIFEAKRGRGDINIINIKDKIERTKRFIEINCYKKVGLKDAAEAVCLSPKYLSRIFKQNTGAGFNKYKLEIKIKKAKELLKNTGYNIEQISDKMGYRNIESFIRIFKKLTGHTPAQYRKLK
jgi:YesN/AraC family two-component response regulator